MTPLRYEISHAAWGVGNSRGMKAPLGKTLEMAGSLRSPPSCHPRQTLRGLKGDLTPTQASYTHCLGKQFCGNRCGRPNLGPASLLSAMGCPWSKAQTPPTIMSEAGRDSLLRSTLEGCLPDGSGMLSLPRGDRTPSTSQSTKTWHESAQHSGTPGGGSLEVPPS